MTFKDGDKDGKHYWLTLADFLEPKPRRPLKFKCKYCGFIQPIDCDPYKDIPAITCQNCKTLIIPGKITIEPDPLGMDIDEPWQEV